jgi:hypothetical protein
LIAETALRVSSLTEYDLGVGVPRYGSASPRR